MRPPRCAEHDHQLPCSSCSADHLAGDHTDPVPACPRCTAEVEADRLRREAFRGRPDTTRAAANDREDD